MNIVAKGQVPWHLLNLSSASKLNSFRLEIRHNRHVVPDDIVWEVYLSLIALLPKSVEYIEVAIAMAFRDWNTYPLPSPRGVVQKLQDFPSLRSLKLSWMVSGSERYAEELMKRMKALLPELDRKGILHCSHQLFKTKEIA